MRIAEINMTHNGSTGKIMLGIAAVARKKVIKCGLFHRGITKRVRMEFGRI